MKVAIVIWDQTKDVYTKSYDLNYPFTNIKLNGRKPNKIIISADMAEDKNVVMKVKKVISRDGLIITTTGVKI